MNDEKAIGEQETTVVGASAGKGPDQMRASASGKKRRNMMAGKYGNNSSKKIGT